MTAKDLWNKLVRTGGVREKNKVFPLSPLHIGGKRIYCVEKTSDDKYTVQTAGDVSFRDIDYSLYGTPELKLWA